MYNTETNIKDRDIWSSLTTKNNKKKNCKALIRDRNLCRNTRNPAWISDFWMKIFSCMFYVWLRWRSDKHLIKIVLPYKIFYRNLGKPINFNDYHFVKKWAYFSKPNSICNAQFDMQIPMEMHSPKPSPYNRSTFIMNLKSSRKFQAQITTPIGIHHMTSWF